MKNWYKEIGASINSTLSKLSAAKLLEELGISKYTQDQQCQRSGPVYSPHVNGWKSGTVFFTSNIIIFTNYDYYNSGYYNCLSSDLVNSFIFKTYSARCWMIPHSMYPKQECYPLEHCKPQSWELYGDTEKLYKNGVRYNQNIWIEVAVCFTPTLS